MLCVVVGAETVAVLHTCLYVHDLSLSLTSIGYVLDAHTKSLTFKLFVGTCFQPRQMKEPGTHERPPSHFLPFAASDSANSFLFLTLTLLVRCDDKWWICSWRL